MAHHGGGGPRGENVDVHKINQAAATRDYNIAPRVDYRTVAKVDGPLVVLDNVKFPKYSIRSPELANEGFTILLKQVC